MIAQNATWNPSCSSCKGSIKEAEEQEEVAAFDRSHPHGSVPRASYTVPLHHEGSQGPLVQSLASQWYSVLFSTSSPRLVNDTVHAAALPGCSLQSAWQASDFCQMAFLHKKGCVLLQGATRLQDVDVAKTLPWCSAHRQTAAVIIGPFLYCGCSSHMSL